MDSTMSNGEWSTSEINMARSLIARFNTNNIVSGGMNKKHNDIVNEIQTMFPMKEKHQVIHLYVDLMVEMMQSGTGDGSYHSTTTSRYLVNNHYSRIGLCSRSFIPVTFGPGTKSGFCPGSKG